MILLITGAVHPGKCQAEAVEAVCRLRQSGMKLDLFIAGYFADQGYKRHIEEIIHRHNCEDFIMFLGPVSDMNSLRGKVDVELVCSRSEGFGRISVEAMLSKLPLIGAISGATPEIVWHGVNGLLYPPGDVSALMDRIERLYEDAPYRCSLGEKGYCIANEKYTAAINADKVYKIYKSLPMRNEPSGRHQRQVR